jgi:shikimate kinase
MSAVFLIGFMGAGKSTVGRALAGRLGLPFFDVDEEIERSEKMSVAAIFDTGGEPAFRAAERAALASLVTKTAIVACGGGAVTDEGSRAILARGRAVYLRVSADEALARIGSETSGRPLLQGGAPAAAIALLSSRESLYESVADIEVDTVGRTPAEIADEIVQRLGGAA